MTIQGRMSHLYPTRLTNMTTKISVKKQTTILNITTLHPYTISYKNKINFF